MNLSILFLLLLLLAGSLVFVALWRQHRARKSNEPICGECGYPVKGLPSFTCPECGFDLRDVGIVTPQMPVPLSPFAKTIILTLFLPIPAYVATHTVKEIVPRVSTQRKRVNLTDPRSGAYSSLKITVHSRGRQTPYRVQQMDLELTNHEGSIITLHIRGKELGYRFMNSRGDTIESSSGMTGDVLLDWLLTAGIDPSDEELQAEAMRILDFVQSAFGRGISRVGIPGFGGMSTNMFGQTSLPQWYMPCALAFWFLVWLLGVRYFMRHRSRLRA